MPTYRVRFYGSYRSKKGKECLVDASHYSWDESCLSFYRDQYGYPFRSYNSNDVRSIEEVHESE